MKEAGNVVDDFKDTVVKGLAAVGIVLSVKGFADMVKGAMDASDAIHGMAREMGISNEKLGEYHHIAKSAGIDTATMDGSVEKLNKNLADIATQGVGPAADALRHYGLSARQLASAGPDAALKASVDLLAKIPNAAERAAVATELFGKSGMAMIRVAGEGAGAIDKLGAEARELGIAISDVDSEKIKEANDAMGQVSNAVQGLINQIAVKLSPYITYAAEKLLDFTREGIRGGSYVSQAFEFIRESIAYVAEALETLKGVAEIVRGVFTQLFATMLNGLADVLDRWNKLPGMMNALKVDTAFLRTWSDVADKVGSAEVGKGFDTMMAADWASKAARKFVTEFTGEVEGGAQKRAVLAAGKEAAFRKGGPFERTKLVERKFASGEATQGSAAAYSAIVQARGHQQTAMQTRIAQDTKTTAEATTRVAAGVGRLVDIATRSVLGEPAMMPGAGG